MRTRDLLGLIILNTTLCLLAAACGETRPPDDTPTGRTLWQGSSDGYTITMREDDIIASDANGPCYSARKDGLRNHQPSQQFSAAQKAAMLTELQQQGCEGIERAIVISVVGPIVSMHHSYGMKCPTYADISAGYSSFDLSRKSRGLTLTDFFDTTDIFHALMAHPLVQRTLANEGWTAPPPIHSFSELLSRLRNITPECEYQFSDDFLQRFAFHHLEGGNVAVELGLDAGDVPCKGRLTALTLLLPIPTSLAGPLERAANGTQGILKREMKKALANTGDAVLMKYESLLPK